MEPATDQSGRMEDKGDSSNKHVVALLREELHKLEYTYSRNVRLKPPEKSVGKAVVSQSVRDRLAYLSQQKESLETDIKNVTRDRNALKDIKTQDEIAEALEKYDKYVATISRKLFKLNEIKRNNTEMIQELDGLTKELNSRNAALRDESDRFEAQKGKLEERVFRAQDALNRLKCENAQLLEEVNSSLGQRAVLIDVLGKAHAEHSSLKRLIGKEAQDGCNVFTAYRVASAKINRYMTLYHKNFAKLQDTLQDLYRLIDEKMDGKKYFNTIRKKREVVEQPGRNRRQHEKFVEQMKVANDQLKFLAREHEHLMAVCDTCQNLEEVSKAYTALDEGNRELVAEVMELDDEVTELSRTNYKMVDKMDELYDTFPPVKVLDDAPELERLGVLVQSAIRELRQVEAAEELAKHSLDLIMPALEDTFELIGGDSGPLAAFLGTKKGFSHHNIDLCLNLTEHRLTELLFQKQYYEAWKEMRGSEENPMVPELIYGSPMAAGGIISPAVHLSGNSTDITEEIEAILHQLDKLEPVLPKDAQHEAKEKVWKQNVRKREEAESAARALLLKMKQSANAVRISQPSKLKPETARNTPPSKISLPKSRSTKSIPEKAGSKSLSSRPSSASATSK